MENKIINLEEARNILKFVKRIYPALNGVRVELGDSFAYYPADLRITIPKIFKDEEVGYDILTHVNREFGADFDLNLRNISVQALLHEIGHHLDFEGKIFTCVIEEYLMAEQYNRNIYNQANEEFSTKVNNYLVELEYYESLDEVDEDTVFRLESKRIELEQEDKELDMLYRFIPTEYAADEFSARFFMTYLRGYKKCNYNVL